MKRLNVEIEDKMHAQIIKVKIKMQQDNPTELVSFTAAVKVVLSRGLQNE